MLLLSAVLLLLFTAFIGLAFPDEGYIVNTGQRILNGQVIYKDFDFVYTPLTGFASFISFFLLGSSIFSERLIALLLSISTSLILFKTSGLITKNTLLRIIPLLVYIAWGPSHINFIWPGMWAVNFGIISFCLLYEATINKKGVLYFLSGLFISFVILTKQNFAVSVILNILFLNVFIEPLRERINQVYLWFGIMLPILIYLIYSEFTNSTWYFLENSYVNVYQLIFLQGSINTPILTGANFLISITKLLFYFSPLLLSLIASFISFKNKKVYLILISFIPLFFLVGFRPVTDYVHLAPLLSLTGIPLLILITSFKKNRPILSYALLIFFTLYTLIGIWSSLFFGYYRWSPPLINQNNFINNKRVGIWTDSSTKLQFQTISNLINNYSKPNEEIFLNYYAPMIYFITNRQNPTRFDYTGLPIKYQENIIKTLFDKKINLVITFYLNKNDKTIIGEFINKNYKKIEEKNEYQAWIRK